MDDTFIRSYIGDLLRSLRTYYLIDLIKPYTRLELSFLAKVSASSVPTRSVLSVCVATERRDPRSRRPLDRADPGRESRWPNRPGRDEAGTRSEVSAYLCFILLILMRFNTRQNVEKTRYAALEKWTEALESVHGAIVGKTGGGRGGAGDPSGMGMPSEAFGSLREIEGRW